MFSKVLSCDDSNARNGIGIRKKLLKMHLIRQISNHLTVGKQQAKVMTESKRINWNRVSIYKPEGECRERQSHSDLCCPVWQPPPTLHLWLPGGGFLWCTQYTANASQPHMALGTTWESADTNHSHPTQVLSTTTLGDIYLTQQVFSECLL